jgi:hypothetical protein
MQVEPPSSVAAGASAPLVASSPPELLVLPLLASLPAVLLSSCAPPGDPLLLPLAELLPLEEPVLGADPELALLPIAPPLEEPPSFGELPLLFPGVLAVPHAAASTTRQKAMADLISSPGSTPDRPKWPWIDK